VAILVIIAMTMLASCGGGVLGAVVLDAGDVDAGSLYEGQDSGPPPDASGWCMSLQERRQAVLDACLPLGTNNFDIETCLQHGGTVEACCAAYADSIIPNQDGCF
jgi:hypothetical protein